MRTLELVAVLSICACTGVTDPLERSLSRLPTVPSDAVVIDGDIYFATEAGGAPTRLTRGERPAWSPDGERITFERDGGIYVIELDGLEETRVASGNGPSWSADGSRIVFASSAGISVVNTDGSGLSTLVRRDLRTDVDGAEQRVYTPTWSPDLQRIVFGHSAGEEADQLFVVDVDGTNLRPLSPGSDPSWSADGSTVVFWVYDKGIATVSAEGARLVSRYRGPVAYDSRPAFSPDGRWISFNTTDPSVLAIPATGGAPVVIVPSGHYATWSPDGSKLAFVGGKGTAYTQSMLSDALPPGREKAGQ